MVKNRIVLPPLVICGLHPEGIVNDRVVAHYAAFAKGGCGIIIQEATCVSPDGRLAGPQLGLWQDSQIEEAKRIVEVCRPSGALLLVQIHYASKQGEPDSIVQVGPSAYHNQDGDHRALDLAEIERIRDDFITAAVRAEKAGYQGVELHAAHGYLLCAFMNHKLNRRSDRYGEPTRLVREIIDGIRQRTGNDFIVAARVGADNPDLPAGHANCRALAEMGVDLLDVSSGMAQDGPLPVPPDFPFSELAWRGCEIKKKTALPVIAVGDLNEPARAALLIEGGFADFAAVGRGMLVDPDWPAKVLAGLPVNPCLDCRTCRWFRNHEKCPGRRRASIPST